MMKNKKKPIRNFEQERAEKLSELGSHLRQVRENQDLSLEDVAARTMIRSGMLHAIEEGKLQHLPEPVYIQGFIRRFADALGLNGAALASDFPTETNLRLFKYSSWIHLSPPQLRPIHLYLVYIFLIMCSVNGMSYMINRSVVQVSGLDNKQELKNQPPQGNQAPTGQLAKVENASLLKNVANSNQAVRVGLTLKAESWIQIVADGKIEFEGVLSEGTQRSWEAKQQLVVIAGNAGGVLVAVNDGQAKQMGEPGKVEEVTVKANPQS